MTNKTRRDSILRNPLTTLHPVVQHSSTNLFDVTFDSVAITVFNTDPLVLSCTLYRMIKEDRLYACFSLSEQQTLIEPYVKQEDRDYAEVIRDYFTQYLVMFALQVGPPTKYKKSLKNFLENKPMTLDDKTVGLAYKLPYFHEYQTGFDEMFTNGNRNTISTGTEPNTKFKDTRKVKFLKTLDARRSRMKSLEFWFEDEHGNKIVVEVKKDNPLLSFFQMVIPTMDEINLTATFYQIEKMFAQFYITYDWRFS